MKAFHQKMLEEADKKLRVGISRTDIDSIIAELREKGIIKPTAEQLVEEEETIRKKIYEAQRKIRRRCEFCRSRLWFGRMANTRSCTTTFEKNRQCSKICMRLAIDHFFLCFLSLSFIASNKA